MTTIKPFKQYREMDDDQRAKISQNPNLHRSKSEETKRKISDTLRKRWAATPHKPTTKIEDIMLEAKEPIRLTEQQFRLIVSETIRKILSQNQDEVSLLGSR